MTEDSEQVERPDPTRANVGEVADMLADASDADILGWMKADSRKGAREAYLAELSERAGLEVRLWHGLPNYYCPSGGCGFAHLDREEVYEHARGCRR